MAVTCGFFNSINHDRLYDAEQMGEMFTGLIRDGIFASIGTAMVVRAATGLTVKIGIGKAWFNGTWTINDTIYLMEAPAAHALQPRIDALVLEINKESDVRNNSFKFVQGVAAANPVRPTLVNTEYVKQYPLCYISRAPTSLSISQSDITNMVGTASTPFITGLLDVISIDQVLGQWETELDEWQDNQENELTDWRNSQQDSFTDWRNSQQDSFTDWRNSQQDSFQLWFNDISEVIDENVATTLTANLREETIKRILLNGFTTGNKTSNEDGTIITHIASDGKTLTKEYSDVDNQMTIILKDRNNVQIAKLVKQYNISDEFGVEFTYIYP